IPEEILAAYGLSPSVVEPAPTGLIHRTFFLDRRFVAQGMHPVFGEEVLDDLDAVTRRLAAAGMTTPRLRPAPPGRRRPRGGPGPAEGRLWRVLTYLDGHTVDEVASPEMAAEAAGLVARFHRVLLDDPIEVKHVRAAVHDTRAHLARLEAAGAGPLGDAILGEARHIEWPGELPRRLGHGGLKLSDSRLRGPPAGAA